MDTNVSLNLAMMGYNERTEKIISCFGKLNRKSTAKILGVSKVWVGFVWRRAGLSYKDEDYLEGWY